MYYQHYLGAAFIDVDLARRVAERKRARHRLMRDCLTALVAVMWLLLGLGLVVYPYITPWLGWTPAALFIMSGLCVLWALALNVVVRLNSHKRGNRHA